MFIQTEKTPNPNSLKFIPGQQVMPEELGTADFRSPQEAKGISPLAERLFNMNGIAGVFLGEDFISITKSDDHDWAVVKPLVLGLIMDHLNAGHPIYNQSNQMSDDDDRIKPSDLDDELSKQIVELLDTRIRPAVARDGGDIRFDRFEDGVVYLKLQGACAGCPSATMTLKAGIENMLRHYIPEVLEVRPVA